MDYSAYLQSPEWQRKRSERLKIDGYKCQRCGRPMDLQVHHLTYDRIGDEDVYKDLITLCKYCHAEIEKEKKLSQISFRSQFFKKNVVDLFLREYEHRDYSAGGDLNLTNINVVKGEWSRWIVKRGIPYPQTPTSMLTDHFRDKRIRFIQQMEAQGATPDQIMARGISPNMVRKYYGNPEMANRILNYNKED